MAPKEKQKIEIEKSHRDPLLSFNQAVTVDCSDFLGTALITVSCDFQPPSRSFGPPSPTLRLFNATSHLSLVTKSPVAHPLSGSMRCRLMPIPFVFILLRTLLQSLKSQLFCFQTIPHSLPKTLRVWGILLTSPRFTQGTKALLW
jgi:hypothetical protein